MIECIDYCLTRTSRNLVTLNYCNGEYYCMYEGNRVFAMDNREGNRERAIKWFKHFYIKHEWD